MNKVIIISAPSGAGKTTIVRHLLTNDERIMFSVSATSREQRSYEKDGFDYYFLQPADFKSKIENMEFLEWEEVYNGTFYGTLKEEVERVFKLNKVVIFDVDVIGGLNLKHYFKNKALAIFINPPSINVLEQRLRLRSTETEEKLNERVNKAKEEMKFAPQFDLVIDNFELETAFKNTQSAVNAFLEG